MNNNRYNLRSSSGQQQQAAAPSFYPTSSTSSTMAAAAVNHGSAFTTRTTTTTTATETTGIPSALLSTSNISQTAFHAGQQHQQQQQFHNHLPQSNFTGQQIPEAQAGSGPSTETVPDHYQQYQHQQQAPAQLGMGGPAATAPFLQDFTLVAEAVKRVQMDAVMTEMESITL